ncbi:MAG: O-antigen ligase family protein [Nitrospirae bacterium]|nr:O-antigen ligase family protein [Nitrospirota bacterium]NTW66629.1 O-antigen ligase family protein [Nitrospirota bacterium]
MQRPAVQNILVGCLLLFSLSIPISKSAVTVTLTLLYLFALYRVVRDQEHRKILSAHLNQPLVLPLALFVAVSALGVFFSEKLSDGLGVLNKISSLFLVYLMTAVVIDSMEDEGRSRGTAEKLLLAFLGGLIVLDLIGLMTYLGVVGHKRFLLPVAPMHVHHIWFANINAVGLYAAVSFLLFGKVRDDRVAKTLVGVFLPFSVFSLLFSTSRTAWLGVLATSIVMAYLFSRKKRVFYIMLAVVVFGCLFAYRFSPIVHERVTTAVSDITQYTAGDRETSLGWRFLMWKASLDMFLSNPVFGIGTGDYVITMERYIGAGTYPASLLQFNQPHNMYLFSLATNGLLGLAALLYLFIRIFSRALPVGEAPTKRQQMSFLAAAVAVHYLVAGLADSLFNIFLLRYTFAFIMGICMRESIKSAMTSR